MAGKPGIYTIGHSTHPLDEFIAILKNHGVTFLVDVRTVPRSRTNPQFNKDSVGEPLRAAGIGYLHVAELGGLRGRKKGAGESVNLFWENKSFRNYADYAMGAEFREGLAVLKEIAARERCAVMCAEAVWWRCHRRIIADYLLAQGYPVFHIMGMGKAEPARMTEGGIVRTGEGLVYAGGD